MGAICWKSKTMITKLLNCYRVYIIKTLSSYYLKFLKNWNTHFILSYLYQQVGCLTHFDVIVIESLAHSVE